MIINKLFNTLNHNWLSKEWRWLIVKCNSITTNYSYLLAIYLASESVLSLYHNDTMTLLVIFISSHPFWWWENWHKCSSKFQKITLLGKEKKDRYTIWSLVYTGRVLLMNTLPEIWTWICFVNLKGHRLQKQINFPHILFDAAE